MSNKDFTFAIMAFNAEKYIHEHLESIKYQIENYGKEYSCHLILGDDRSEDMTVEKVKLWLKENHSLFSSTQIITNADNKGIVLNYLSIVKNVKTKYFKVLAADDLYSKYSVFEAVELMHDYDFVQAPLIWFDKDGVIKDYQIYRNINLVNTTNVNRIKKIIKFGSYLIHASALYTPELIGNYEQHILSQYTMLEDQPLFYSIFNNKNVKYCFYPKPITLYRVNPLSVTRARNSATEKLEKDNLKYIHFKTNHTTSFLMTSYFNFQKMSFSSKRITRRLNTLRVGYIYYKLYLLFLNCMSLAKTKKMVKQLKREGFSDNDIYIKHIQNVKCNY